MATASISTFDDLLDVLERNPHYRSRLRQSILDDEFRRLPQQVATLTEVTTSLAERMDQLTERMDQLTEQMREQSGQINFIMLQLRDSDARFAALEERMDRFRGAEAERRFRGYAPAYFGRLLRRIRVVDRSRLADEIDDAIDAGTFAEADREPLLLLDVVVRGRDVETREERYLAAEISFGIGEGDILRAVDRAALLERLTGVPVIPVVGGYSISSKFRSIADERRVQVVIVQEPT